MILNNHKITQPTDFQFFHPPVCRPEINHWWKSTGPEMTL